MEINSPGRVNYKAGSDQLVRLVQEHSGHEELSTDLSVHSANSEADSLAPLVQEAVDDLASLDDDTSGGTATAEAKPAGIKPVTRDYAAEKAAIEVDDESSSGTSQGPTDQCTLSSDESSFDENEQLLIQASKKSTHTSAQSKITRFASNLPKPSRGTDTKSKPVRSDFVPNAVKINRTAQPNPAQQTTTTFKKSLLVTNGGNGLRRSSRLDAAFTQSISAASYEGLADMEDKNTAAHTELDWPSIFSTLLAETTSSTDPMESFSHPKQGPFRIVNSLSGPVLVNRRGIRLFHLGKEHHIDTAPPVSDFMFDAECEFTMKSLEQIDRDRVTRRLQDKVKEHGGDTRSPAHPDNGPFSILRQPEWGTKTLWVLNSKGEQVQQVLPQDYKNPSPWSAMSYDLYHLDAEHTFTRNQLGYIKVDDLFSLLAEEVTRSHPRQPSMSDAHATNSPFYLQVEDNGTVFVYNKHKDPVFELPPSIICAERRDKAHRSEVAANIQESQANQESRDLSPLQAKALDADFENNFSSHNGSSNHAEMEIDQLERRQNPIFSQSIDDYSLENHQFLPHSSSRSYLTFPTKKLSRISPLLTPRTVLFEFAAIRPPRPN
jgi:hypothetical protein